MKTAKERSLSKGNEEFKITWYNYLYYINQLVDKVKESKLKFKYVYGIPRGGLIPAIIISHQLNLKLIKGLSYMDNYDIKKLLVVDDIIDTGETIKGYILDKVYTAVIFKHKKSPLEPNFYVKETDKWIKFPYEKD